MSSSDDKRDPSLSRDPMYLPLRIDEAVYVRGALKNVLKQMKMGEERDIVRQVFDRLDDMYLKLTSYSQGLSF